MSVQGHSRSSYELKKKFIMGVSKQCVRYIIIIIIIIIIITDLYSAFRSEDTEALDAAQED